MRTSKRSRPSIGSSILLASAIGVACAAEAPPKQATPPSGTQDPEPSKHEQVALPPLVSLRALGETDLEARRRANPAAGDGWVSLGYVDRLARAVAAVQKVGPEQRAPAAMTAAAAAFRGRIPDSLANRLKALALTSRERLHVELQGLLDEHADLFAEACGATVGAMVEKMQRVRPGEGAVVMWELCSMNRFQFFPKRDSGGHMVVAAMTYVALQKRGGVLEGERMLLRDMAVPPDIAFASYAEQRVALEGDTNPAEAAPQAWEYVDPPKGVEAVRYPSGARDLAAWVWAPTGRKKKLPALVYFHGGFAFGLGDFEDTEPFRDAGFVVMMPTVRGENGNPGGFEMLLGEVDDAAAAVRWIAQHPRVDERRVYAFGHSVGGGLASLVTLVPDLPLVHSGSAGGLMLETGFESMADIAPFDVVDRRQTAPRVLFEHVDEMHYPHHAWLAGEGSEAFIAITLQYQSEPTMLTSKFLPDADHYSQLAPAMDAYIDCIRSNQC